MLATYYTGDLAPINQARTADYEAQTRRMGTDQAYLLGLLQGVNQGRQVGVNERQVDTSGLLGGLNYRLGQDQVGARNRETDVRERLGNEQIAFNRDQLATEAALRSTELSDRDRQFSAGLLDAAAARQAYFGSPESKGTLAPGVQIELLRRKEQRDNMVRAANDAAQRINDAVDASIYDDAHYDITESPEDIRGAIAKGDVGKLQLHKKAIDAIRMQLGPEVSALVTIDPRTLKATPIQIPDITFPSADVGAGLQGGIVQPIQPTRSNALRGFLGRSFDPTLMLRQ